jgi:hypothetical protein
MEEGKSYTCQIGHEINRNLNRALDFLIHRAPEIAVKSNQRLRNVGVSESQGFTFVVGCIKLIVTTAFFILFFKVVTIQQDCFYYYRYLHPNDTAEENAGSGSDAEGSSSSSSHHPKRQQMYFHSFIDASTGWLREPIFGHFSTSPEPAKDQEPIHAYATNLDAYRLFNFGDEREADTDLNLVRGRHMNFALPRIEGVGAYLW